MLQDEIKAIQGRLNILGFDAGSVDGLWGNRCITALKSFQHKHGLTVDGVAGPMTRAKLFGTSLDAQVTDRVQSVIQQNISTVNSLIGETQLKRLFPAAKQSLVDAIVNHPEKFHRVGINSKIRMAGFLANVGTETGGLRAVEENLNYSAERLLVIFKKYYTPSLAQAEQRNPEKIANRVYGGRLGNTQPGDGFRYRGGGMLQTTGRYNYAKAGYENNPDALRNPDTALDAALTFWHDNRCNAAADTQDVAKLRKIINGGTHGLDDTKLYYSNAMRII